VILRQGPAVQQIADFSGPSGVDEFSHGFDSLLPFRKGFALEWGLAPLVAHSRRHVQGLRGPAEQTVQNFPGREDVAGLCLRDEAKDDLPQVLRTHGPEQLGTKSSHPPGVRIARAAAVAFRPSTASVAAVIAV
jgi:hypothetical protein